ncbi:MAG: ComEC/Rec2 family competence protein, partial [Chloroflexi bacterium]|nr:ComEC/Rec2 family competence protein [Chloroflexota bacterium]
LLIVLWIYAAFVGASASVVRAVMMTSVALVGQWLWRRGFTLNTLCAAGFFMLLVQPFYLVDVGFQLSFGATLGLVLVADVLTSLVPPALMNMRLLGMVLEGVLLTTAAQITTLPLLLIHYEQLSLITLLTNGMVLPLQPPIMGLGMVAALAGVISRDIGTIVALPVFTLLRVSIRLIEITAAVPWAAISLGRFGAPWAVAYYAAMFGLLALQAVGPGVRQRGWRWLRPRLGRLGAAAGMAGVAAAVAAGVWSRPPAQAQVWLRGSSALLLAPDGAQIVVLGDGDPVGLVAQRLPWGDGAVDIAVLPRLDARAQEQALGFLRTYGAAELVIPPPAVLTDTVYQFWMQTPPAAIGRVRVVSGGEQDAAVWAAGGLRARAVALANDDLGNGILGLRLRGDAVRVDLFAAGELTSGQAYAVCCTDHGESGDAARRANRLADLEPGAARWGGCGCRCAP